MTTTADSFSLKKYVKARTGTDYYVFFDKHRVVTVTVSMLEHNMSQKNAEWTKDGRWADRRRSI